jgi:para-nitrobenzyl esterase
MDRVTREIEGVTVEAACGRLAGLRAGDVFAFKGIPFGKPPVGPLRWRAPGAAEPWAGVRDATLFGPICPQAPTQIEALLGGTLGEQSEDCLYLNVWTPGCDSGKRPVMVWIHGGAFVIGAGSQGIYNGRHLAGRDVVVVTINYRLGVFGFLNLADATDGQTPGSGAEGIADQLLALRWVKQNIAAFGGDPDNLTIFGESAGAMSVAALMSSPAARGLFHKAIAQSGAAHVGYARKRSARVAHALLQELGVSQSEAATLPDVPYGALVKAQIALLAGARDGGDSRRLGTVAFQPTINGTLIPDKPILNVRAGSAHGIPLLAGTTKDEWRLFSAVSPRVRLMSRTLFESRVRKSASDAAPAMLSAYGDGTTFDRFNAVMTDRVFTTPTIRMLEAQGQYAPVYAYRFDWRSRLLGGIMGSCHALELGFVFGTYNTKLAGAFFGAGASADALSDSMMECWTNFARTGDPSGRKSGTWPRYDEQTRDTMIFGDGAPHVVERPNEARRLVWNAWPEDKLGP